MNFFLALVTMVAILLCTSGCASMYTQQPIQNISILSPGMTKNEVQQIIGPPAKSEFSGSIMVWHYCRTGYEVDSFASIFFENDKVIEARNYSVTIRDTGGVTGDCINFIRPVDFNRPNDMKHNVRKDTLSAAKISGTPLSDVIDVLVEGIDDGLRSNKQQDREEATLNAKLQAVERAGINITSITTVENFILKKDWIEKKAEAILMPGFQLMDKGYQEDGTYLIILSGKIKPIDMKVKQ